MVVPRSLAMLLIIVMFMHYNYFSEHITVAHPIQNFNFINMTLFLHTPPPHPCEGEENISCTSGEELSNSEGSSLTSTAIKRKMDSLAGSTYGESTDTEAEREGQRRYKEWSVGWCINKIKSGFKRFLKYRIDEHGEYNIMLQCEVSLLYLIPD